MIGPEGRQEIKGIRASHSWKLPSLPPLFLVDKFLGCGPIAQPKLGNRTRETRTTAPSSHFPSSRLKSCAADSYPCGLSPPSSDLSPFLTHPLPSAAAESSPLLCGHKAFSAAGQRMRSTHATENHQAGSWQASLRASKRTGTLSWRTQLQSPLLALWCLFLHPLEALWASDTCFIIHHPCSMPHQ